MTPNETNIVDVPNSDSASKTIGAIKVTSYSIGAILLVALFVRSASKLSGAITSHGAISYLGFL